MNNEMTLVYDVNAKPKFFKLILFALQELLAIITATLLVPVIVSNSTGIEMSPAAALAGAGVGTIVYVIFTKGKSPIFLGSSFAFINSMIATMSAAMAGAASSALGFAGIIIGAAMAGLIYVLIAILVKIFGNKWVSKLMPAVIIGPTVAIIGLSLSAGAIENLLSGSSYLTLGLGILALIITTLCSVYGKKFAKLVPFIIGILVVYLLAVGLSILGDKLDIELLKGLVDLQPFVDAFGGEINFNTFFEIPEFTILKALDGFKELTLGYIAIVAVAYVPVAFVVFAEHIADHENMSSVIGKNLIAEPGLHRTLLGDGIGSAVGAIVGGCPNTSYGESIACVAISRNASVATSITTAILAILLSFFKPFVIFVNSIPSYIMGGISIALYGFIAVSGLKMLQKINLSSNKNLFVVSTILVTGIGGLALTFTVPDGTIEITNVACALVLGIIMNLILREPKEKKAECTKPKEKHSNKKSKTPEDPYKDIKDELDSMKLESTLKERIKVDKEILDEIEKEEKVVSTPEVIETESKGQLQFNFDDGKIYCISDMPKEVAKDEPLQSQEQPKDETPVQDNSELVEKLNKIYQSKFADYESMTLISLRDIAKARGIKGCFRMKKVELIAVLKEYDNSNK